MLPGGSPGYSNVRGSKMKAIGFGLFAIVIGLLASIAVSGVIARGAKNEAGSVASTPVVVANQPVPAGTTLQSDMVEVKRFAADTVPDGAVAEPARVLDRVVRFSLARGEPIVESRVTSLQSGKDTSALVPPDLRALSVRVNEAVALSGLIHPGMFVDVIVTSPPIDDRGALTRNILRRVQVLAVGNKLSFDVKKTGVADLLGGGGGNRSDDQTARNVVTLVVTPDQAERLALANKEGDLQLAIRNVADQGEPDSPGVSLKALLTPGEGMGFPAKTPGVSDSGMTSSAAPSAPRRRSPDRGNRPAEPTVEMVR